LKYLFVMVLNCERGSGRVQRCKSASLCVFCNLSVETLELIFPESLQILFGFLNSVKFLLLPSFFNLILHTIWIYILKMMTKNVSLMLFMHIT
jgi:hypothetical protein